MVDRPVLTRNSPMFAVIDPYAAAWLLNAYPIESDAERHATWLRSTGHAAEADRVLGSVAQLREASRQRSAWLRAQGADVGTSAQAAAVGPAQWSAIEITTTEAASMLGLSETMTRRMLRDRRLLGRRVHARAWAVDRGSVLAVLEGCSA